MHTTNPNELKARIVLRVASSNFLEMYDFMVYDYYAKAIADTLLPAGNKLLSLMLSLVTFGAGFLMRPLGAISLGVYIDRHGRHTGLIVTLALMARGTLLIVPVSGHATIGLAAPLLVLIDRLLQGFSADVELGGVSVYSAETATLSKKSFFVSWQSASQQVAIMFVVLPGVLMSYLLPPSEMSVWGWRVPSLIGYLIVPSLFIIRRSLQEMEEFQKRKHHPDLRAMFRSIGQNWRLVGTGTLMVMMTTISFCLITAYTLTFGKSMLHLSNMDSLIVTLCVGASSFFWLSVMGAVSDRAGCRLLLILFTVLMLMTAYLAIQWLVAAPPFARMLTVLLWLSFLYGSYSGAMVVTLIEIMSPEVRTTGFSLAYSLATVIFGGFIPAIATWLVHETGSKAMPGMWVSLTALCGLIATLAIVKPAGRHEYGAGMAPVVWRAFGMKEHLLEGNLSEGCFGFRLLFSSRTFLWSTPLSLPAGTDSLFSVLLKKSKQKKGALEMAIPP